MSDGRRELPEEKSEEDTEEEEEEEDVEDEEDEEETEDENQHTEKVFVFLIKKLQNPCFHNILST